MAEQEGGGGALLFYMKKTFLAKPGGERDLGGSANVLTFRNIFSFESNPKTLVSASVVKQKSIWEI